MFKRVEGLLMLKFVPVFFLFGAVSMGFGAAIVPAAEPTQPLGRLMVDEEHVSDLAHEITKRLTQKDVAHLQQVHKGNRALYQFSQLPVITFEFRKTNPFPPADIAPGPGRPWMAQEIIVKDPRPGPHDNYDVQYDNPRIKTERLLALLPYFPHLKKLSISWAFTDADFAKLPRTLRSLNVSNTSITGVGFADLPPSLISLDISGCTNVTIDITRQLLISRPHLGVIVDGKNTLKLNDFTN